MVIVMAPGATDADVAGVVTHIEAHGGQAFVSRGVMRTIVGVVGTEDVLETLDASNVGGLPGVAETMRITAPYKLVSAQNHSKRTTIRVGGVPIGPDTFTLIAGPCAVETPEQTLEAARMAKRAGATLLRGGAYKPRTSPVRVPGSRACDGLRILAEVRDEVGAAGRHRGHGRRRRRRRRRARRHAADRHPQHAELRAAAGGRRAPGKPVMLKRGLTATYEEWLMAAEYIAQRGNLDIVLCERGVRSFEPAIRNMLDVSAVAMVQRMSHLPVIVDPSHAAGRRDLVVPLARAGIAAGADGVMVDVHPHPEAALCDGAQALFGEALDELAAGGGDDPAAARPHQRRAPRRLNGADPTRSGAARQEGRTRSPAFGPSRRGCAPPYGVVHRRQMPTTPRESRQRNVPSGSPGCG